MGLCAVLTQCVCSSQTPSPPSLRVIWHRCLVTTEARAPGQTVDVRSGKISRASSHHFDPACHGSVPGLSSNISQHGNMWKWLSAVKKEPLKGLIHKCFSSDVLVLFISATTETSDYHHRVSDELQLSHIYRGASFTLQINKFINGRSRLSAVESLVQCQSLICLRYNMKKKTVTLFSCPALPLSQDQAQSYSTQNSFPYVSMIDYSWLWVRMELSSRNFYR